MRDPREQVVARIVARYAHPSRAAYLYLFRVAPGTAVVPLIPDPDQVAVAWVDEGSGLREMPATEAVIRCHTTRESALAILKVGKSAPLTADQRRQQMGRVVIFSIDQHETTLITVDLLSRALAFSPKGDRRVIETWRLTPEGVWYSAPTDRE